MISGFLGLVPPPTVPMPVLYAGGLEEYKEKIGSRSSLGEQGSARVSCANLRVVGRVERCSFLVVMADSAEPPLQLPIGAWC